MLKVDYVDIPKRWSDDKDISEFYPCGGDAYLSELSKEEVRIFRTKEDKKYLDMWVSESEGENIAENRVRILLNGLCIVDTVEDLIDYKFKSINYIYLVKKLTSESLIENVLYKFYGCSDNDTLVYTDMEEDPYIYRGKNKEDKIFDYYKTKAELISSIGQLKSMVPVFLRQTTKESVVDSSTGEVTGYQLRNQTIAPYTMGSYVFLSNGDTVEEVCSQISKFHKRNTIVTVNSDLVTLKTYTDWNEHTTVGTLIVPFTVPVDNFFEYTSNSTSSTDEIESDYMDVYIGSTYISQDRYKIRKNFTYEGKKYDYVLDFRDASDITDDYNSGITTDGYYDKSDADHTNVYKYVIEENRSVYITFYYNSYPEVDSPIMRLIDGHDIIKESIPVDRLEDVSTTSKSTGETTLVTASALRELKEEFIDSLERFTGNNVLHLDSESVSGKVLDVDPYFIFKAVVPTGKGLILNKRSGSTIFLKLDRALTTNAQVLLSGIYDDQSMSTTWGDTMLYPIYTPDDVRYNNYDGTSEDADTTVTDSESYPVSGYEFNKGDIVQLVYNDVKTSGESTEGRFYVNNGSRYRLVEINATATRNLPIVIDESEYPLDETSDINIYLASDIGTNDSVMSNIRCHPSVEYRHGVDTISVRKDEDVNALVEGTDYTIDYEHGIIKVLNIGNLETPTFHIKVTSIRSVRGVI